MDWTEENFEKATRAVEQLLNGLALEEYRFRVVPRGSEWEVRVEYAAADGWKTGTLRVADSLLSKSREDEELQNTLAGRWLQRLKGARRSAQRSAVLAIEATALGHAWAEDKAKQLHDEPGVVDWPDYWDEADNGPLPADVGLKERREMLARAIAAARERWREIVAEEGSGSSLETDEDQATAAAERLRERLRSSLPPGIAAGIDGQRVYLTDTIRGMERTVESEAAAWRVVEEWGQMLEPEGPT